METSNPLKKQNSALKALSQFASILFVIFCVVVIFFNVTHEYHTISGDSMVPTLNNNGSTDGVFITKIGKYTRGDIIVAHTGELDEDTNQEKIVIKRLIAIGGDKIAVKEYDGYNRIFLIYNDSVEETMLDEPYLSDYTKNNDLKARFEAMIIIYGLSQDANGYITLASDEVFYLGDNRPNSRDCISYGPVKKSNICGVVDFIVYGNENPYFQVIKQLFGGK